MKVASARFLRSLLLSSLFLMGFALSAPTRNMQAQAAETKSGHEFDYFSDATLRQRVGFVIFCKSGQVFRSGRVTQFVTVQPSGC